MPPPPVLEEESGEAAAFARFASSLEKSFEAVRDVPARVEQTVSFDVFSVTPPNCCGCGFEVVLLEFGWNAGTDLLETRPASCRASTGAKCMFAGSSFALGAAEILATEPSTDPGDAMRRSFVFMIIPRRSMARLYCDRFSPVIVVSLCFPEPFFFFFFVPAAAPAARDADFNFLDFVDAALTGADDGGGSALPKAIGGGGRDDAAICRERSARWAPIRGADSDRGMPSFCALCQ
mmetsp:Transcript_23018/g.58160  ORF Transcript_23018/g.58160 Transcript_23018/m.58160 type:complete len:235 (+) Transcript_23018:2321-3025(+)